MCDCLMCAGLPHVAEAVIRAISVFSLVLWTGIVVKDSTSMKKEKEG